MTKPVRWSSPGVPVLLLLVLAASVRLWWPSPAFLLVMPSDDSQLIDVDRAVLAGHWDRLLTPQDVHVYPLFRVSRLYFELHFVESYWWLQFVAIAAHLASVVLLFLLSRRFLRANWSALLAAVLFAWHALGRVAFLRKADNTYVLSLPLLLGALYCLCRLERSGSRRWAVGCGLCLAAAVGVHSIVAMLAIPGILLGYELLTPEPAPGSDSRAKRHRRVAWLACLLPLVAGIGLWAAAWLPYAAGRPAGHRPIAQNSAEFLAWLLEAVRGTLWHFAFLARRTHPAPPFVAAAALAFAALLIAARGTLSFRWMVTLGVMTGLPIFVTLFVRSFNDYQTSRYFYQSSLLAVAAAASGFDLLLSKLKPHRRLRSLVIAVLIAAAPFYYASQKRLVIQTLRELEATPASTHDFWAGWSKFFDQAAAGAPSGGFRLPHALIGPSVYLDEVFNVCNPRGKRGIVVLSADSTHIADCTNFWREVKKQKTVAEFSKALPPSTSMIVQGSHRPAPESDAWVCRAWADDPPSTPLVLN